MPRKEKRKFTLEQLNKFYQICDNQMMVSILGDHLGNQLWKSFTENNFQLPLESLTSFAKEKLGEYLGNIQIP
jgi:hypothetical protein